MSIWQKIILFIKEFCEALYVLLGNEVTPDIDVNPPQKPPIIIPPVDKGDKGRKKKGRRR